MRILIVANLYPSPSNPAFGTFVAARAQALRELDQEVDVVAITDARVHRNLMGKYLRLTARSLFAAVACRLKRRRYDIVEAHIAFPTGLPAWIAARVGGSKLVLFAHGSDVTKVPWRSRISTTLARFVFQRADLIVANSSFTATHVARLGPLLREPVVISPGIEVPDEIAAKGRGRRGILFVGRLTREKGVRELIEAFASLAGQRGAGLTIVGDGPDRAQLEHLARSLNLNVTFTGSMASRHVATLYDQAAVVAMPSVYDEPLGLVALEAMAHGAILVATRTGGLAETVRDGENAIATPPGDIAGLREALLRALLIAGRPEGEALRNRGRTTAMEHEIHRVVRRSLAVFDGLS